MSSQEDTPIPDLPENKMIVTTYNSYNMANFRHSENLDNIKGHFSWN